MSLEDDWCLGAGFGVGTGLNVNQEVYSASGDKDEWYLEILLYGLQPYRQVNSTTVNCHGYAMMRNDAPFGWYGEWESYANEIALDYVNGEISDITEKMKNDLYKILKTEFEVWLYDNQYTVTEEINFSSTNQNAVLDINQYRVVLRTGIQILQGDLSAFYGVTADYHFWYQTYDGRWANKHGQGSSEHLPQGTTPFSSGSSGWSLQLGLSYVFTDFYDSDIAVYIITID